MTPRTLSLHLIAAMDKPSLKKVLESDFQAAVVAFAKQHDWLVSYTRISKGMSPSGEPDLRFAKENRNPFFAELKREETYLEPAQKEWRDALGETYYRLWRPRMAREIMDELGRTYAIGEEA